jgi:hypothetical protein
MPPSFRSGWNYMDNEYQQYLERWIPFRMEGGSWMADCTPYHPSYSNYRVPGTMRGWEVRHYYMKDFTSTVAANVFNVAQGGKDQVVCIWSHQNESDFPAQITAVHANLVNAAAARPDVRFLYCSAREAMQRWLGNPGTAPPPLTLYPQPSGPNMAVAIVTSPDIYQLQPYVAARRYTGEYARLDCVALGPGLWRVTYPAATMDRVAVAVTDIHGNAAIAEVDDGSRRWATQSDYDYAGIQTLDECTSANRLLLAAGPPVPVVEQVTSNSQTAAVKRSYWLAQTFVPTAPDISGVTIGANISQPAVFRVELRPLLANGFPDDNPGALLATANVALGATGSTTAPLSHSGMQIDGRAYAVTVKLVSGTAQLWINTANPYAGGILERAYSLDWITIPAFDLYFAIYDGSGTPAISQLTRNSQAYTSENGYFVAQTFMSPVANIRGIEVGVAQSLTGEALSVQLRQTLGDGSPDFAFDTLFPAATLSLNGPGRHFLPVNWSIPPGMLGQPLAVTFVAPSSGRSSVRLWLDDRNPYADGSLYLSNDLADMQRQPAQDLYLRLFTGSYETSGTATFRHDAGRSVAWTRLQGEIADLPPQTGLSLRSRFGNTPAEVNSAAWTTWQAGPDLLFSPQPVARILEAQARLETSGANSPALAGFEMFFTPPPAAVDPGLWSHYD